MASSSYSRERGTFETTKRLLFHLVNEGLVCATIQCAESGDGRWLCLQKLGAHKESTRRVRVSLYPNVVVQILGNQVLSLLKPESLAPPVTLEQDIGGSSNSWIDLDPGTLFDFVYPWFGKEDQLDVKAQMILDLRNSAANQEKWLEISKSNSLGLRSPAINWEKTLIWGHPTHPFHRTCSAQPPLKPVEPDDLSKMINPSLTFLSLPRTDVRISGLFEEILRPLLERLNVGEPPPDRIIIPSLTQQQPSIVDRFPNAVPIFSSPCASAQASMRTVTTLPELGFPYHLKMALACNITSALRTITPWSACGGLAVSELLTKLLPDGLWVFREIAAVCGSQEDFNEAKHLSCILREDLELRAKSHNETLIIAAGLAQRTVDDSRSYAERLFELDTTEKRQSWFRQYTACFLGLTLPPLLNHGICLEGHGQNMVARVCLKTKTIKGFAVRDFGGLRLHMPTLHSQGHQLDAVMPGSAITTDDLPAVWNKAHHTIFQNHLTLLLCALRLEHEGGWPIIREEMRKVLQPDGNLKGRQLIKFFLRNNMPFKCFVRMKLEGKYRDASHPFQVFEMYKYSFGASM